MRISDWSSDVCSSDLQAHTVVAFARDRAAVVDLGPLGEPDERTRLLVEHIDRRDARTGARNGAAVGDARRRGADGDARVGGAVEAIVAALAADRSRIDERERAFRIRIRSEEHTSELQSLMRISY